MHIFNEERRYHSWDGEFDVGREMEKWRTTRCWRVLDEGNDSGHDQHGLQDDEEASLDLHTLFL